MRLLSLTLMVALLADQIYGTIQAPTPIPNRMAVECGCRPVSGGPQLLLPHYAESGFRTTADSLLGGCRSEPGPGLRLPEDGVYGYVRYSHVASMDHPGDHEWHDFNFYMAFDEQFQHLNSDGNYLNNNPFLDCVRPAEQACTQRYPENSKAGERLMEMEWDSTHFPEKFWPHVGDRAWVFGRYIWDCGHPEAYHNEIHPPSAVAFTRVETDTAALGGTTDLINKTYVYIHGRSGLTCLFTDYLNSPVATHDYSFSVPLPVPRPPGAQPFAEVVELPYGGPSPKLEIKLDAADERKNEVKVVYPLDLGNPSPSRRYGAIIASGWRNQNPPVTYRRLEVKVTKLKVRRRHGLLCQSDWHLWLNVNGQWVKLQNTFGLLDGTDILINKTFRVSVPDTDRGRLIMQVSGWVASADQLFGSRLGPVEFFAKFPSLANLIEGDFADATKEGKIGLFFRRYTKLSNNFGIGATFESDPGDLSSKFQEVDGSFGQNSTDGDFGLYYTIRAVP